MKTSLILSTVLFFSLASYSQEFKVPNNYSLGSKEDYARYEKDVIAAAKWLVLTPLNQQLQKRNAVSQFIIKWINGNPTVNVEINSVIHDFENTNPGMMVIYMASSARYVLENNYSTDIRAMQMSALEDMIKVYRSGKGITTDKKMDKLVKAGEAGKLHEWLTKNLKVQGRG